VRPATITPGASRAPPITRPAQLVSLVLLATLALLAPGLIAADDPPPTTVLFVRHAEKASTPADDPPLTPEGTTRATTLLRVAKDSGLKAIYATQFARTQQTVQPLAAHLKLPITQLPAANIDALVANIRSHHRGEAVLVAAHSNTIPDIIQKLGADPIPPIAELEFDNFYVITIPASARAHTVRLHYGEPYQPK